jgi:hypothetical protein
LPSPLYNLKASEAFGNGGVESFARPWKLLIIWMYSQLFGVLSDHLVHIPHDRHIYEKPLGWIA